MQKDQNGFRPGGSPRGWRLGLALLVLAGVPAQLKSESVPQLKLPACAEPPIIDGVLNDSAWQGATMVDRFFVIGTNLTARKHRVWLTRDNAWLYAGFEVEQSEAERIEPKYAAGHDLPVDRDDNVKIAFAPAGESQSLYLFELNRANVRRDQRRQPGDAWSVPWKSAVVNSPSNWTAELAVPFCLMPPLDRLQDARLNVEIACHVPTRDLQGVVINEPVCTRYSLAPLRAHSFDARFFALATDLWKLQPAPLFLPFLMKADLLPFAESNGNYSYGVSAVLTNFGAERGAAILEIEDRPPDSPQAVTVKEVGLAAGQTSIVVRVPAPTPARRSAVVRLCDSATGEEWQRLEFAGAATLALELFSGYLDRNYYTAEKAAEAHLTIRLPDSALSSCTLSVEDAQGAVLAQTGKLQPETVLPIKLESIAAGRHILKFRVRDKGRKELAALELALTRRPPRPNCEWKIDHVNRVVLNNGNPFFAMGFCTHHLATNDTATLKKLRESGFNFLMLWEKYDAAGMADYARLFEQEGLYVMPVPDDAAARARGKYTFRHDKASWCKPDTVTEMKGHMVGRGFAQVSREDRNAVFREYLDYLMPDILKIVAAAGRSPACLGYFIFDEPMIHYFDQGLIGRDLYDQIHATDGYHPVLVNYSSEIPAAEQAANWMDILATDPYWIPASPESGLRGTINWVSMITARTFYRGAARRQATWIIPMCNSWSACVKRGATRQEQFCQTYLAAIHGATGIMYFDLSQARQDEVWEAAAAMARQFADVLGAACTAPAARHTITYAARNAAGQTAPVVHDPAAVKFADIQMTLKRDPAGGHILMAANSRPYPVQCAIAVKGLAAPKIGRYFSGTEYAVRQGGFADEFEAYGVRAYRLPELAEPVEISVTTTPPEKIPEPETTVAWRGDRKNKMPNPSFELTPGGRPSYCGIGGNKVFVDTNVFKFGRQSLRLDGGYIQPEADPPRQPGINGEYIFSLWLKGANEGRVEIKDLGQLVFLENIYVTRDWKRYEFPFVITRPGRLIFTIVPYNHGSLWVDGLQLEQGVETTEFED